MKPYDILAIGELNVDLILNNIDGEPEVGKEKFAGDMILTLGSSTAIFAANAAALGAKVGFVGMIGQDTLGNLIRESLEAKGVDTSAREYALAHHLPLTELRPDYRRYRKGAPLKRTIEIIERADFVLIWRRPCYGNLSGCNGGHVVCRYRQIGI